MKQYYGIFIIEYLLTKQIIVHLFYFINYEVHFVSALKFKSL